MQREPKAGLVGFPPGLRRRLSTCRAVFTCILATARAGAWVPGDTAGEWPRWLAPCWGAQPEFPSEL